MASKDVPIGPPSRPDWEATAVQRRPPWINVKPVDGTRIGASVAAGNPPFPGEDTSVTEHDGEVMGAPSVYAIYYGSAFGDDTNGLNGTGQEMNAFLTSLETSAYIALLAEYGVAKPKFAGSAWVGTGGIATTQTSKQILSELFALLDEPASPVAIRPDVNNTNLVYVLFVDQFTTLQSDSGHQCEPGGGNICGYHSWGWYHKDVVGIPYGKANIFFAAICYPPSTMAVSHELVEIFTDRSGNGWFGANTNSEIGDICNQCGSGTVVTGEGYTVASYWLYSENRCLQQFDVTPGSGPQSVAVPSVVGKDPTAAAKFIRAAGLVPNFDNTYANVEHPIVVSQNPRAGILELPGAVVTIEVVNPRGIQP